jgi:hypothetical protein
MNSTTSGYDRDLFDRVLLGVSDPGERVKTILCWRGFLARRDGAGVFLCTGSMDCDVKMLQQFGFDVRRIEGHPDNWVEILAPDAVADETLFQLFNRPPRHRLPGPFGFDITFRQDWNTFKKRKFGAKIPVEILDLGIALLVKVLPLLGLHVIDACDGHLAYPPHIRLLSTHHLNWARLLLPSFAPQGKGFERQWVFQSAPWNSPRWDFPEETGVWLLGTTGCGESLEGRFSFYTAIQSLAVNIMEGGRSSRLRKAKKRLLSPQALERAADLRDELRVIRPLINGDVERGTKT